MTNESFKQLALSAVAGVPHATFNFTDWTTLDFKYKNAALMTIESFRQLALSFPGSTEQPHFEKLSYRLNNKIFATLDVAESRACIKLDEVSQSVFCSTAPAAIYPVNNKWGKQGWTIVELSVIKTPLAREMLQFGFQSIGVKKKPASK